MAAIITQDMPNTLGESLTRGLIKQAACADGDKVRAVMGRLRLPLYGAGSRRLGARVRAAIAEFSKCPGRVSVQHEHIGEKHEHYQAFHASLSRKDGSMGFVKCDISRKIGVHIDFQRGIISGHAVSRIMQSTSVKTTDYLYQLTFHQMLAMWLASCNDTFHPTDDKAQALFTHYGVGYWNYDDGRLYGEVAPEDREPIMTTFIPAETLTGSLKMEWLKATTTKQA